MKVWQVELTRRAYKQFKKLPETLRDIVDEAISDIEQQGPAPKYWDVKKIGKTGYRLRLNYRGLLIEIFYVGHRKDAY